MKLWLGVTPAKHRLKEMKHYLKILFLIPIFLVSVRLNSESFIDKLKEGDLIFQETFSEQGKAITHSYIMECPKFRA
ncbi:hypothetical protein LEP1GSC062_0556 [Leptospira alexanderi serovar Manhao 3 str. L 60]|uniref:Uncharacterized protein n=1 Tax=Leptospira alexanderi serovar Manhao 3 str. L 60 TaxID=1049759 RepID=V6I2K4_9LEPT|nr:hypothetical protein LEP1GSC062_0556 [Leptospira alexanderi serovar Manhao 3 str. L 60]